ncbi:MAG: ABC transporter permease [Candidatus Krumholzibacteria bacterium]|nr:ABC transporter permease [Candidatus Krumholzibacteria bacterium]
MKRIDPLRLTWLIARTDLALTFKDRSTVVWAFIMPFVFIFVFGQFGNSSGPSGASATITVENNDRGPLGDDLINTLRRENIALVDSLAAGADAVRTLVIPDDFSEKVFSRERTAVYLRKNEGSNAQAGETAAIAIARGLIKVVSALLEIENGMIGAGSPYLSVSGDSLNGNLQMVIDNMPAGGVMLESRIDSLMARDPGVLIDSELAGRGVEPPGGFQGSVPGNLVMFVLMMMAFGGVTLVIERKSRVLMRIGVSPAGRREIVAGKLLGRMMLGSLQILVLLVAGRYIFGINLGNAIPALVVLMLSFAFCAGGFSILFGSLFSNPDQVSGFAVITTLAMSALGGCWWPLEIVSEPFRIVAFLLPTGWAMDGIHKLISFGYGFSSVVTHIVVLLLFGLVFMAIAAKRLKLHD